MNLDERVLRVFRTVGHDARSERAVAEFSRLGEHAGVWLAIGVTGWSVDVSRRPAWRRATGTVAGVYALNTAIKFVVRRQRPQLVDLPALTKTPTQLSFPSAHASTAFTGALAYSRLGLPAGALYSLALGLAASRLYLGVHYPSDVVAGALLGTLVAALATESDPVENAAHPGKGPVRLVEDAVHAVQQPVEPVGEVSP
jgi:membrane-associated phospholipid phosphatase